MRYVHQLRVVEDSWNAKNVLCKRDTYIIQMYLLKFFVVKDRNLGRAVCLDHSSIHTAAVQWKSNCKI